MQFKTFVKNKIEYFTNHFKKSAMLLDYTGQTLKQINLSFDKISDEYLQKIQEQQINQSIVKSEPLQITSIQQGFIKICDQDLKQFWDHINNSYQQLFNVTNQNITDETLLKISQLYQNRKCGFVCLDFSGNHRITQVGVIKLGKVLRDVPQFRDINLHGLCVGAQGVNRIIELIAVNGLFNIDFGLIGNQSLKYLSKVLENPHKLESLGFGQDLNDPWTDGKIHFQNVIRKCQYSKIILSINLYPQNPINHYDFISQLCILCRKNRNHKIDQRENQFKSLSLNPSHHQYYDPDNHSLNAYKFSVKSYLTNVFGSLLDEALYFLEKQRRNSLRQEAIFKITKQPINKIILEDICTADGSIIVLTKYLLAKIHEKQVSH